jgi:hypothetical protein
VRLMPLRISLPLMLAVRFLISISFLLIRVVEDVKLKAGFSRHCLQG